MSQPAHVADVKLNVLQQSDAQIAGARGTFLGNMELHELQWKS